MDFKLKYFLLSLTLFISINASSTENIDTIPSLIQSSNSEALDLKPTFYIKLAVGAYTNSTFGTHPLVNMAVGLEKGSNKFKAVFETRLGDTKNDYSILENDTLKSTNIFNSVYIGLEYERTLFRNAKHDFYSNIGLGYDWIQIQQDDVFTNKNIIGGLAFNIGLGYAFYINEKHGPDIMIIYQYADFNNSGGTDICKNSIVLRLSYLFGNTYKK